MIQKVCTFANVGLLGYEIQVESDSSKALPSIEIIGLPDTAIKESKERLRATFRNVEISLPKRKFILNLAPSDIKKIGTSFDLPMAVALLLLIFDGEVAHKDQIQHFLFFGELGLDGSVKRVNGLLPSVISAKEKGFKHFFIPAENLYELEYIPDIHIYPLKHFSQLRDFFLSGSEITSIINTKNIKELAEEQQTFDHDFSYIKGHLLARRALSIATAGFHNVVMVGAPGSGKTMLSKAMRSILPPLSFSEMLETSQIYSVVGKLNKELPLVTQRPFRTVHHTASKISIIGGGSNLVPGEVSLAHKGILFFDELTEFPRETLEVLRQPLEDREIHISRVSGTIQYPASFMFVASMNPCKCGYYKDREKACQCSLTEIKRYQSRISGPLLDRIDMILEIPRENIDTILTKTSGESSEIIREKVVKARSLQQERFKEIGLTSNAQMSAKEIDTFIPLDSGTKDFLSEAAMKLNLSGRVIHRTMKLARTIADMDGKKDVEISHLGEAIQYRSRTMFVESE